MANVRSQLAFVGVELVARGRGRRARSRSSARRRPRAAWFGDVQHESAIRPTARTGCPNGSWRRRWSCRRALGTALNTTSDRDVVRFRRRSRRNRRRSGRRWPLRWFLRSRRSLWRRGWWRLRRLRGNRCSEEGDGQGDRRNCFHHTSLRPTVMVTALVQCQRHFKGRRISLSTHALTIICQ
jgi:hypothetical protein